MRYAGTLVAGAFAAILIFVILVAVMSCGQEPSAEGSCRDRAAIGLYGSYKACAKYERSIGNDPETGLPR